MVSLSMIMIFTLQIPVSYAIAGDTGNVSTPISDEHYLYYHHSDHLGSSNLLTEGKESALHSGVTYKKGDLLQRFEYEPFGKEKYILNPNLKFDPSYTGQIYDVETGLYYYNARYYNPELGRFIQADTIVPDAENLQAHNRYSYVLNNPFKYTDPSGHSFMSWFKKLAGIFIGAAITALTFGAAALATAAQIAAVAGTAAATTVSAAVATLSIAQVALIGAISGFIGGAIGGAISGGGRGALMGAAFGLASGAVMGAAGQALSTAVGQGASMAIMAGVGIGMSAGTGGWRGLIEFGVGMLGAVAGGLALQGIRRGLENAEYQRYLEENHIEGGGGTATGKKQLIKMISADVEKDLNKFLGRYRESNRVAFTSDSPVQYDKIEIKFGGVGDLMQSSGEGRFNQLAGGGPLVGSLEIKVWGPNQWEATSWQVSKFQIVSTDLGGNIQESRFVPISYTEALKYDITWQTLSHYESMSQCTFH